MKSFLKIVQVLAIIPLLVFSLKVGGVQAAGPTSFNNMVGDDDFLRGRNVTQNGSFTDPVAANAGDEVDVAVYYHNTGPDAEATNTIIKAVVPTNTGTQHVITGTIAADGVAPVSGTIVNGQEVGPANLTVNSLTATTMQFVPGSVRWYPRQATTTGPGQNVPDGSNGDSIVTTGVNIGTVKVCFEFSGTVMFRVKLAGVPVPTLNITKNVRKAGSTDAFAPTVTVKPGDKVEYQIAVKNVDATSTALNVSLKDVLPTGITYVGPAFITTPNGKTVDLTTPTFDAGQILAAQLLPGQTVMLNFTALTSSGITKTDCLTNTATASAGNAANQPQATAQTCFKILLPPNMTISKAVRVVGTTDFLSSDTANPGNQLEYQVSVTNTDGAVAILNLNLRDVLPAGISYVGPTIVHFSNNTTAQLGGDITSQQGAIVAATLNAGDTIRVTFLAQSATSLTNSLCLDNHVIASATNVTGQPDATARTCFLVVSPTAAPTPTPVVSNPVPILPKTGPEGIGTLAILGTTGMGGVLASRYLLLKRSLKNALKNIEIR